MVSGEEDLECVDFVEWLPSSHMSKLTMSKLLGLPENVIFVPTTARSIEQFQRMEFFSQFKYAIVDNGGTILKDGKPLESWKIHIDTILNSYKHGLGCIVDLLNLYLRGTQCDATVVDNRLIFAKVENAEDCKLFIDNILDKELWHYSLFLNKLCIFPKCVDKFEAVTYLQGVLKEEFLITAGDSSLDLTMIQGADVALVPKHGELWRKTMQIPTSTLVVSEGVIASEQILDAVVSISHMH